LGIGLLNHQRVYQLRELEKQKEEELLEQVAFEMQERAVPRHDYEIVDGTGGCNRIVTSGTMSPSMNKRN
jgi:aminomethyltransferase